MRFEDTLHISRLADFLPHLLSGGLEGLICAKVFRKDPLLCACAATVLADRDPEAGLALLRKAESDAAIGQCGDTALRLMTVARAVLGFEPGLVNEPVLRRRNWMALEMALCAMDRDVEIGKEILSGIESGRLDSLSAHREIERLFARRDERKEAEAAEPDASEERLTQVLIDLLPKAHRGVRRQVGQVISEAGISQAHYPVLRIIAETDGVQMRTILEALGLAPPSVYAAIAALERDGLIEKKPHPSDRRSVIIKATRRGVEKFMDCQVRIASWSRSLPIRITQSMADALENLAASGGPERDADDTLQLPLE